MYPNSISTNEKHPVFYKVDDIAEIMNVSRSSAYKLFSSPAFPSIKMGGILRIEKSSFEKWLKSYEGKSFKF